MNMHAPKPAHKPVKTPEPKRRCHRCHATGRMHCPICMGKGQVMQGMDTNGCPKFIQCAGCFGLKTARCSVCSGEGFL